MQKIARFPFVKNRNVRLKDYYPSRSYMMQTLCVFRHVVVLRLSVHTSDNSFEIRSVSYLQESKTPITRRLSLGSIRCNGGNVSAYLIHNSVSDIAAPLIFTHTYIARQNMSTENGIREQKQRAASRKVRVRNIFEPDGMILTTEVVK